MDSIFIPNIWFSVFTAVYCIVNYFIAMKLDDEDPMDKSIFVLYLYLGIPILLVSFIYFGFEWVYEALMIPFYWDYFFTKNYDNLTDEAAEMLFDKYINQLQGVEIGKKYSVSDRHGAYIYRKYLMKDSFRFNHPRFYDKKFLKGLYNHAESTYTFTDPGEELFDQFVQMFHARKPISSWIFYLIDNKNVYKVESVEVIQASFDGGKGVVHRHTVTFKLTGVELWK